MAPALIGTIGLGATAAGGAISAGGSLFKGASEMQMYQYQAGIAQINAGIARRNEGFAYQAGDKKVEILGQKYAQQNSMIKSAQAAGGLDITSGSNLQVQQSQQKVAQTDISQQRANTAKVAYDYATQAHMFDQQAKLYKKAGQNSMIAGAIGAVGSIVGTAGSVADKWLQGQQVGMQSYLGS